MEKYFVKKSFLALLICVSALSGCGKEDTSVRDGNGAAVSGSREDKETAPQKTDSKETDSEEAVPALSVPVNTEAETVHFPVENGIDPARAVHRCCADGSNLYLAYGEPDLYILPIGGEAHRPAGLENPEGLSVCHIAMDPAGGLHLLMGDPGAGKWYIWRLEEAFRVDRILDVSAYFEKGQTPLWFLVDGEGNYYVQWLIDRDGIIVDRDGGLRHCFTLRSLGVDWTYEAAAGRDGKIYLVYDDRDAGLEIGVLDADTCSLRRDEDARPIPGGETLSAMSAGTDTTLLLFSPFSGIWVYDREKNVLENRVSLADMGLESDTDYQPLAFLPDGRLLLAGTPDDGAQERRILKFIPAGR